MKTFPSRNARALSLPELLVTLAILAALVGLAFPVYGAVAEAIRRTQARVDVIALRDAMLAYRAQYQADPLPDLGPEIQKQIMPGSEFRFSSDNDRVLNFLRARPGSDSPNPDGTVFFQTPRRAPGGTRTLRGGLSPGGTFYDPWGHPYEIFIAYHGNGPLRVGDEKTAPISVNTGIAVFSRGPNGRFDGDRSGADDICSWR